MIYIYDIIPRKGAMNGCVRVLGCCSYHNNNNIIIIAFSLTARVIMGEGVELVGLRVGLGGG